MLGSGRVIWISEIRLEGFGIFGEAEFAFDPGMNLILGPNESGKSTLINSVPALLYCHGKDFSGYMTEPAARCRAWLTLTGENGRLRIARDFADGRVSVEELDPDRHVIFEDRVTAQSRGTHKNTYAELLADQLGISDRDLFCGTVFVGQAELDRIGESDVARGIRRILTGSRAQDYEVILERLKNRYFEITKDNPWKARGKTLDRLLEETEKRIQQLEEDVRESDATAIRVRELDEKIAALRQQIKDAEKDLNDRRIFLDAGQRFADLLGSRQQAKTEFEALASRKAEADRLSASRDRLREDLGEFDGFEHLPEDAAEAVSNYMQLATLRKETAQREEPAPSERPRGLFKPVLLSISLLAVLLFTGGLIAHLLEKGLAKALVGAGLLLAATAFGLLLSRILLQRKGTRDQAAEAVREREETILPAKMEAIRKKLAPALDLTPESAPSVLERLRRYEKLRRGLFEIDAKIDGVSDGNLEAEYVDAVHKTAVAEELITMMKKDYPFLEGLDASALAAAVSERERIEREEVEARGTLVDLERERAVTTKGYVPVDTLSDELEEARNRRALLIRERDGLQVAVDLLSESVDEFREGYLEDLSAEVSGVVRGLTAGRHERVILDEQFTPRIDGGSDKFLPPQQMSRGTADQVYLGLRLALSRTVAGGRRLPLMLDDPMVNFDPQRRRAALDALLSMAKEHQILLLVHDPVYLDLVPTGVRVIKLENSQSG